MSKYIPKGGYVTIDCDGLIITEGDFSTDNEIKAKFDYIKEQLDEYYKDVSMGPQKKPFLFTNYIVGGQSSTTRQSMYGFCTLWGTFKVIIGPYVIHLLGYAITILS